MHPQCTAACRCWNIVAKVESHFLNKTKTVCIYKFRARIQTKSMTECGRKILNGFTTWYRYIARDHVTSHRAWRQEPALHAQCGVRELAWTPNSVWPSRGRSPRPVDCASLNAAQKKARDPLNFKNHMRRGGLHPQGFGPS